MDTPAGSAGAHDSPCMREVRIACHRCGKPVATATSLYRREWFLGGRSDGGITPEGQLRGGIYADSGRTRWRSRIWDVSPDRTRDKTWETGEGIGRYKLVCNRRHRDSRGRPTLVQRTVTLETLTRACDAAIAMSGRPSPDYVGPHPVDGVTWSGSMCAQITLADLR